MSVHLETSVRSCHPSQAQIEVLLEFLERRPALAKGFSRTLAAREKSRKDWEQITLRLNSIAGSTTKTWKQWMKYWSDKKSAVKKKAFLRTANRNRTDGGTDDVIELTEMEEKIITLMGTSQQQDPLTSQQQDPLTSQQQDPLTSHTVTPWEDDKSSIFIDTEDPIIRRPALGHRTSTCSQIPHTSGNSPRHRRIIEATDANAGPCNYPPNTIHQPYNVTLHPETEDPIIRRRPALRHNPTRSQIPHTSGTTPRRRRLAAMGSLPSQRRNLLTRVAERLLRVEEQRADIERAQVEQNGQLIEAVTNLCESIISQNAQSSRMSAQAMTSLGEGLVKMGEGMLALSSAIQRNRYSD